MAGGGWHTDLEGQEWPFLLLCLPCSRKGLWLNTVPALLYLCWRNNAHSCFGSTAECVIVI